MLSEQQIIENKSKFINLVKSISREYSDIDGLVQYLEQSDFFEAPASTRFHGSFKGGLCQHCLNVYDTLNKLMQDFYPEPAVMLDNEVINESNSICPYTHDSILIAALFHDISKTNFYELTPRNKKVYSENGGTIDKALGKRYDWVTTFEYSVKPEQERFMLGEHGQNSAYIISGYIPLTQEEYAAICGHHGMCDNPKFDMTPIYNRYSLACLLHVADMLSTFIFKS